MWFISLLRIHMDSAGSLGGSGQTIADAYIAAWKVAQSVTACSMRSSLTVIHGGVLQCRVSCDATSYLPQLVQGGKRGIDCKEDSSGGSRTREPVPGWRVLVLDCSPGSSRTFAQGQSFLVARARWAAKHLAESIEGLRQRTEWMRDSFEVSAVA